MSNNIVPRGWEQLHRTQGGGLILASLSVESYTGLQHHVEVSIRAAISTRPERSGTRARAGAYTPTRALERCRRGLHLETPPEPPFGRPRIGIERADDLPGYLIRTLV